MGEGGCLIPNLFRVIQKPRPACDTAFWSSPVPLSPLLGCKKEVKVIVAHVSNSLRPHGL